MCILDNYPQVLSHCPTYNCASYLSGLSSIGFSVSILVCVCVCVCEGDFTMTGYQVTQLSHPRLLLQLLLNISHYAKQVKVLCVLLANSCLNSNHLDYFFFSYFIFGGWLKFQLHLNLIRLNKNFKKLFLVLTTTFFNNWIIFYFNIILEIY